MTTISEWGHLSQPGAIRARAKVLSRSIRGMRRELVQQRRATGMKQKHVAEVMGVSQQRVSDIERYDSDLTLETIRSYANAVGALIEVNVEADHGRAVLDSPARPWTTIPLSLAAPTASSSERPARGAWRDETHIVSESRTADFTLAA